MPVGYCLVHLRLPENGSLKGKRQVLRSVTDRLRHRFNVSIAEVSDNDVWRRASLGISCVSNEASHCHEMLEKVVDAIQAARLDAELLDYEIKVLQT